MICSKYIWFLHGEYSIITSTMCAISVFYLQKFCIWLRKWSKFFSFVLLPQIKMDCIVHTISIHHTFKITSLGFFFFIFSRSQHKVKRSRYVSFPFHICFMWVFLPLPVFGVYCFYLLCYNLIYFGLHWDDIEKSV